GARPYLDHLHVRPTHRGRGLGERLMRAAAARLRAQGRTGLWLWVLASNAGARRFYARLGALEEDRAILAPYGQRHLSLRLGWRGAEAMARLADGG
ncbi:MAG: GNAT family N-acetyltransferase, partial [Pseudomonadota bacterium]